MRKFVSQDPLKLGFIKSLERALRYRYRRVFLVAARREGVDLFLGRYIYLGRGQSGRDAKIFDDVIERRIVFSLDGNRARQSKRDTRRPPITYQ